MPYFDAHCHLQDPRLRPQLEAALQRCEQAGIGCAVVNGTCESDWPEVAALAERYPKQILPSFGLHPWRVAQAGATWQKTLLEYWNRFPSSGVGEIGLDRWIPDANLETQQEAFRWQLEFAAAENRPASLHCLKAWGALTETLESSRLPERGFLLHSFGGSIEILERLLPLGAYASISGYFAHPRKMAQLDAFKASPHDRLLIETDCPDMLGPEACQTFHLADPAGEPINHPANLPAIYRFAADALGSNLADLELRVAENWRRFFG